MRKHSNRGITYDRIYSMVRRIPKGRVATYGQIACLAGIPRQPRQIGYALAALRDHHPVPWHRVVNSKGEISQRSEPGFEERQRILLESEGVVFDVTGRISLSRFLWRPKDAMRHPTEMRHDVRALAGQQAGASDDRHAVEVQ